MIENLKKFFKKNKIPFRNYIVVISKNSNDFNRILQDEKFLILCFKKIKEKNAKKLILRNNNISIEFFPYLNISEKLNPKERINFWIDIYKKYKIDKVIFE